jgi:hypothetical protein
MSTLFGTDAWRRAADLQGSDRKTFLHDLFRDQLRQHGSRYVRSFEIHAGGSNGYHLFFGTTHPRGLEKIKEAMWSLDPVAGQNFSDSTISDQLVLFEPTVDTRPLRAALRAHFGTRVFTIDEAEEFTLLQTAFVPSSHLRRRTLLPAEKEMHLEVIGGRSRPGSYPSGSRPRFLR